MIREIWVALVLVDPFPDLVQIVWIFLLVETQILKKDPTIFVDTLNRFNVIQHY